MPQKPEILARRMVAQSRLFRIESFDLRFSNGVERTYERLVPGGPGAVMLVALLDDNTFALIREYGGGMEDYSLSFYPRVRLIWVKACVTPATVSCKKKSAMVRASLCF